MDQSSFKVINYGTCFTMPLVWEVKLVQSFDEYASTNGMNSRLFDRRVRCPCLFEAKLHTVSRKLRVENLLLHWVRTIRGGYDSDLPLFNTAALLAQFALEHSFAEDKDTNS